MYIYHLQFCFDEHDEEIMKLWFLDLPICVTNQFVCEHFGSDEHDEAMMKLWFHENYATYIFNILINPENKRLKTKYVNM